MEEVKLELGRLLGMKVAMMSEILENARQDLEQVWQQRKVGARTRVVFLASLLEDQDEELLRIGEETGNVEEDLSANKDLLKKLTTFLQRDDRKCGKEYRRVEARGGGKRYENV